MARLKYLARGFFFETSADEGGTYTKIGGVTKWGDSHDPTDADATDFDSGGWGAALTTKIAYSVAIDGQFLVNPRTGERDPGQLAVERSARRVGPLGLRRYRVSAIPTLTFLATSDDDTLTIPGHEFADGDQVRVFANSIGMALPTGLEDGGSYYVISVADDTLQLSATDGGAAIALTTDGEGELGIVLGSITFDGNAKLKERGGGNEDLLSWGCDLMSYGRPSFTGCFAD